MGKLPQQDGGAASALRKEAQRLPEVQVMFEKISELANGKLEFKISTMPNGDWVAESVNLPGILTGGTRDDDVNDLIADATFTFFDIPSKYCSALKLFNAGTKKQWLTGKRLAYYSTAPKTTAGA